MVKFQIPTVFSLENVWAIVATLLTLVFHCQLKSLYIQVFYYYDFFYTHLGYPLNFIFVFRLRHEGIPPPSRGKVGKNRSIWSNTTVRS